MSCLIAPFMILFYFGLIVVARQNLRRVSGADHLFLATVLVVVPVVNLCGCVLGPAWVLRLTPVVLYTAYSRLLEFVLMATLLGVAVRRQKPSYAVLAILLVSLAVFVDKLPALEQLTFGMMVDAAGAWGVLRATADRMPM